MTLLAVLIINILGIPTIFLNGVSIFNAGSVHLGHKWHKPWQLLVIILCSCAKLGIAIFDIWYISQLVK